MKGYRKYFGKKIIWFLITFVVAVFLNFFLPRLMPADPVAAITGKMANGMSDASAVQEIYERYAEQFGTNKPMAEQFLIFCKNAIHGDFGLSFSQYPRSVSNIISSAIMWTICLQLPAILVGWLLATCSAPWRRTSARDLTRFCSRPSCFWATSRLSVWQ